MTIPVVVVPDGTDVAGIGLEEQPGRSEGTAALRSTDGAGRGVARFAQRALVLEPGFAVRAGKVVCRHP